MIRCTFVSSVLSVALVLTTPACAKPVSGPALGPVTPAVVAAEPEAADAGMKILKRGGTAIDAAVAIQATLSLVEPQSSGIGGGGFLLYYDAASGRTTVYNGRETAPAAATPDRFLKPDGKPMSYPEAVTSGRATGVPGAMFALEKAHKDHGKLKWQTLFADPSLLATNGFTVSRRLGRYLQTGNFAQKQVPDAKAYFGTADGGYLKTGDTLKNPAYAATLKTIAWQGMDAYRKGPLADQIIAKVNAAPLPGGMTLSDLAGYQPQVLDPICLPYRVYIVCEAPPPAGGVSVLQALKVMERFPLSEWGKDDARAWAVMIEASRLTYADRDQYMADPDFITVPVGGLLDPGYIAARAALITVGKAAPAPKYGVPKDAPTLAPDRTLEPNGTSHFVVIDSYGNAVSMTTTVESIFGTGRMVGGFFLNNQLTDFSWTPVTTEGVKAANAVAGGKRPRSAMSPAMLFDRDGKLVGLIGSPGGPSIVAYNIKTIMGVADFGLSLQDAIKLPNVVARGDSIRVEASRMPDAIKASLRGMGYPLTEVQGEESGLNGLLRQPDGSFKGGADPRRNGAIRIGNQRIDQ
jgi:gamma-glutamyltranspeptidase / glutathione hydrolase